MKVRQMTALRNLTQFILMCYVCGYDIRDGDREETYKLNKIRILCL